MTASNLVIKIGGSTLGAHDTTLQDLVTLQRGGALPVVVHGGGALITQWLDRHGIASRFVRGLRVTDPTSMEVVTAVLAGLVNKQLVAAIQALGGRAAGISGVDGHLISGRLQDADLGLVGEVAATDLGVIEALRGAGFIPVVAPVGFYSAAKTDAGSRDAPLLLNFNADTLAGELAACLKAELLVFLTDVPGVKDAAGAVISSLSKQDAAALIEAGTASGGMIPKLQACLRACEGGAASWIVDGREAHALLRTVSPHPIGTSIR